MNARFYIAYFAINPYGADVPAKALLAAREALDSQLGGACQVLAAKAAFEEAGGLRAFSHEFYPPAITRWTAAAFGALNAAYGAERPLQATIEDIEQLNAACIDVVAAARYAYTEDEWLRVFTAHFGMSDYCESHQEAMAAGRRWLAIAREACPIAAAEQEIRSCCQRGRPPILARTDDPSTSASSNLTRLGSPNSQGVQTCA